MSQSGWRRSRRLADCRSSPVHCDRYAACGKQVEKPQPGLMSNEAHSLTDPGESWHETRDTARHVSVATSVVVVCARAGWLRRIRTGHINGPRSLPTPAATGAYGQDASHPRIGGTAVRSPVLSERASSAPRQQPRRGKKPACCSGIPQRVNGRVLDFHTYEMARRTQPGDRRTGNQGRCAHSPVHVSLNFMYRRVQSFTLMMRRPRSLAA